MKPIFIPSTIEDAMARGAALVVSVSGGKDSQALARALAALHRERGWRGDLIAVHADLGRIEWKQTPGHVKRIADESEIPLEIVRRRNGVGKWDMVDRWKERAETMQAKGQQPRPWSDAKNRFCTAEMKRGPIDTFLRRYDLVVSAEGIRGQESKARSKKPVFKSRAQICTKTREAWTWNAIFDWTIDDVWGSLGGSVEDLRRRQELYRAGQVDEALRGWQAHPVYVMGNERLSCAFCILGCKNDLENAARHNPELLDELISIEDQYGFTFQPRRSLKSLKAVA